MGLPSWFCITILPLDQLICGVFHWYNVAFIHVNAWVFFKFTAFYAHLNYILHSLHISYVDGSTLLLAYLCLCWECFFTPLTNIAVMEYISSIDQTSVAVDCLILILAWVAFKWMNKLSLHPPKRNYLAKNVLSEVAEGGMNRFTINFKDSSLEC